MKTITTLVFVYISTLSPYVSYSQSDFYDRYKAFSELIQSQNFYELNSEITIYKNEAIIQSMNYRVKKNGLNYFISLGNTERIMNSEMVITMSREMKSIVLGPRQEEDTSFISTEMYFDQMKSMAEQGLIQLKSKSDDKSVYSISVNSGPYTSMEVSFNENRITEILCFYSDPKASYTHARIKFDYQLETIPSDQYFSINRYANLIGGEYQLRPEFSNYKLSLN